MSEKEYFYGLTTEDAKEQRKSLREIVVCFIGALCLAFLVIAAKEAYGAPVHVWSDGQTTIKLLPSPCVEPVVKRFLESAGVLSRFKAIDSTFRYQNGGSMPHKGCWAEYSAEESGSVPVFVMLFDDGDRLIVPKEEFFKKPKKPGQLEV